MLVFGVLLVVLLLSVLAATAESYPLGAVVPLYGDSGCIDIACSGGCEQDYMGWLCWKTGAFERYDDQMNALPIEVSVRAYCTAVGLYTKSGTCTATEMGSGRVTAQTSCWIQAWWISLFASGCWQTTSRSWCQCEEL
jgi:hypothetical protein